LQGRFKLFFYPFEGFFGLTGSRPHHAPVSGFALMTRIGCGHLCGQRLEHFLNFAGFAKKPARLRQGVQKPDQRGIKRRIGLEAILRPGAARRRG
jgi:hypothetical protein